jgi:hypothetical protein
MVFFAENSMGKHLHELSPAQREELEDVVRYVGAKLSHLQARHTRARQARLEAEHKYKERAARKKQGLLGEQQQQQQQPMNGSQSAPPPRLSAAAFRLSANVQLPTLQPSLAVSTATTSPVLAMPRPRPQQRRTALRLQERQQQQQQRRGAKSLSVFCPTSGSSPAGSPGVIASPYSSARSSPTAASGAEQSPSLSQFHRASTSEEEEEEFDDADLDDEHFSDEEEEGETSAATEQTRNNIVDPSASADSQNSSSSSGDSSCACTDDDAAWPAHVAAGTLPAGYDPALDPMKLNLAPVTYLHRPLTIYLGVAGLGLLAGTYMRWLGFRRFQAGPLCYWYRAAVRTAAEKKARTPQADPAVFIHGIGIGTTRQSLAVLFHFCLLDFECKELIVSLSCCLMFLLVFFSLRAHLPRSDSCARSHRRFFRLGDDVFRAQFVRVGAALDQHAAPLERRRTLTATTRAVHGGHALQTRDGRTGAHRRGRCGHDGRDCSPSFASLELARSAEQLPSDPLLGRRTLVRHFRVDLVREVPF